MLNPPWRTCVWLSGGDARFGVSASFESASFGTGGFFYKAVFDGDSNFENSDFPQRAIFRAAEFRGPTSFKISVMADADFSRAKFRNDVSFGASRFSNQANFDEACFEGSTAIFAFSTFSGSALFNAHEQTSSGKALFEGVNIDFRDVVVSPPEALVFRNADLTECRFLNTDLRKAEFTSVVWPRVGTRIGVYDEIAPISAGEERPLGRLERLYRDLKQNYEDRRSYDLAGDFHYGEKSMRRKNRSTPFTQRALLSAYCLVSGYGEKYLRPVIWAATLMIVCAFAYLHFGLATKDGARMLTVTNTQDWLRALHYSFQIMTVLKPDDLLPIGWAKAVNTLEALLGPVLIALFALALRQRLKR